MIHIQSVEEETLLYAIQIYLDSSLFSFQINKFNLVLPFDIW